MLINKVLQGLHFTYMYAYIDDVLIASTSGEEHKQHLQQVFECLRDYAIIINPAKCVFGALALDFLGHHVNCYGIQPLEDEVKVIWDFPQPSTQQNSLVWLIFNIISTTTMPRCFSHLVTC